MIKLSAPEDAFDHLHPDVRHIALAPLRQRKMAIYTERWIDYPAGVDAHDRMFELLMVPPRTRMPSLLFWAAPNMGKTFIQRHFLELFAEEHAGLGLEPSQVLYYELSGDLDERRLFLELLMAMDAPAPDHASPTRLQKAVIDGLRARQVRMLILDEFQKVSKLRKRLSSQVVDALRLLSSQANLCLVAFGSSEAKGIIEADPHLAERFEIVGLPKWERREAWAVRIVEERISYMPLRKPTEIDAEFMDMLKARSDESLGRMFRLLERCAVAALGNEECITPALIDAIALRKRRVAWSRKA